jgi:23S rRNA (cytosine1962-C5)-methyltransferase
MTTEIIDTITLKPGKEKSILNGHPWIFSGAISKARQDLKPGLVKVISSKDKVLGFGVYNPHSGIRIRLFTFPGNPEFSENLLKERISEAVTRRRNLNERVLPKPDHNEHQDSKNQENKNQKDHKNPEYNNKADSAVRLIFGESDELPGLIVDQYGDGLVIQFLAWSAEFFRHQIIKYLTEILKPEFIYERSDSDARTQDGLPAAVGFLYGSVKSLKLTGTDSFMQNDSIQNSFADSGISTRTVFDKIQTLSSDPASVIIRENNFRFLVNIHSGHKTGMYIDQKSNRSKIRPYIKGDVLNVFSYTGGFTVNAAASGADSITCIDDSAEALALDYFNMGLNGFIGNNKQKKLTYLKGDAFRILRQMRDENKRFHTIILDPPKFAHTHKQAETASRGYKDINLLAMKMLEKGGFLITFSCSGGISEDLFQKIVFGAAVDAGKRVRIAERLYQGSDHPVLLNFPESSYLKGFILSVE